LVPESVMTQEVFSTFQDPFAVCQDDCDGILTGIIVTGGDIVDTSQVGKYVICYDCKNSQNNSAPQVCRTVFIEDSHCPSCELVGDNTTRVEASFPYFDAGAQCSDNVDGILSPNMTSSDGINVEATGTYYVTWRVQDFSQHWNDASTCKGGKETVRTVIVVDTLVPVIALHYGNVSGAIHTGEALNTGVNGEFNPAYAYQVARAAMLMQLAPAQHVASGIPLAASAVGAALLGMLLAVSRQRTTSYTAVPV